MKQNKTEQLKIAETQIFADKKVIGQCTGRQPLTICHFV